MRVPVVFVRKVLVRVRHLRMPMTMRVAVRWSVARFMVVMVRVVFMFVLMFRGFGTMRVLVPLAQMQPDPQRHQ